MLLSLANSGETEGPRAEEAKGPLGHRLKAPPLLCPAAWVPGPQQAGSQGAVGSGSPHPKKLLTTRLFLAPETRRHVCPCPHDPGSAPGLSTQTPAGLSSQLGSSFRAETVFYSQNPHIPVASLTDLC